MSMEMRRLGAHGPEISVVGYGAWEAGGEEWGPNESDERVVESIGAALEAGMNWIDTAEVYGSGRSEELVGRAIAGRRDEVLVFTKVAPHEWDGSGLRPAEIRGAIERSLARLDVEHVDLYQVHKPDEAVPLEETWAAMAEIAVAGLARCIGLSNVDRAQVERCMAIRHVDSVQNQFSLLYRDDEKSFLPWLAAHGVGYLAYGPLGFGLLTGALSSGHAFGADDWRSSARLDEDGLFGRRSFGANVGVAERLQEIGTRIGTSAAPLALRWALSRPGVSGVIAGSRNPDHVRENATAGSLALATQTLAAIEATTAASAPRA
jgi:aryl-alcohol dehydrogenase-like predicted oxidoreductase